MLKNHNHDLVKQLSEVSSSLWRMDEYQKNAKGCAHCEKMWSEMKKQLNNMSDALTAEINRHSKENRFE
jgi:hypothetical protein